MALYGTRYTYVYTTQEEITRLFSENGTDYHVDDYSDSDEIYIEICERATGIVNQYAAKIFDLVDLQRSPRIRHITTNIACYLLSIRRGNPSLYGDQYLEALADLESIVNGEFYIPELPRSSSFPIFAHNVSSDNRIPYAPMRIDTISATKLTGKEQTNFINVFSWL
jgi:hypothetical protein